MVREKHIFTDPDGTKKWNRPIDPETGKPMHGFADKKKPTSKPVSKPR